MQLTNNFFNIESNCKKTSNPLTVHLTLKLDDDEKSMNYMNFLKLNEYINKHSEFKASNIIAQTSINENFIAFVSLLKRKVYQLYKLNRLTCPIIE